MSDKQLPEYQLIIELASGKQTVLDLDALTAKYHVGPAEAVALTQESLDDVLRKEGLPPGVTRLTVQRNFRR